jgi:uncharacterized repeat protein (TIGR01451 family)
MNSSTAKLKSNNSQPRYVNLVLHNLKFTPFLDCAFKSIFFKLPLASAILFATAKTAQGQTALTSITSHRENAAVTNYTTGTTVAPTSSNNYTWGGTNGNLILDGVTVGGNNFAATRFADQINLKRVNNTNHSGSVNFIWAEDANPTISGNPYQLAPAYPGSNMENALLGNIINLGSDNIFNNGTDAGNNIERIDYIFSSGIKVVSPTTQGFVVLERNGNDPFKIAGIKTLSGTNPSTYGSNLVAVATTQWGGSIPIVTDTLKDPPSGSLPFLPFRSDIGSQNIKGVFISLANLGFVAGDTVYGYSLVGNDADSSCLNNPNVCPQGTSDADGGLDFISGGGIFSVADFGDAPDTYGTDSSNDSGEGFGASHTIVSTLKLGATAPDSEIDAQTPLNGTGDGADEDGITTFPSLGTSTTSYSLTATVNNTTGSAANVYSWIDFDRDGKFDEDERAIVSNGTGTNGITLQSGKVPTGSNGTVTLTWNNIGSTGANIIDGNSYARIRLTTDDLNPTASGTGRDSASVGIASNGEIEDYAIAIAKSSDYGDAPDTYGTDNTANNSSSDPVGASHTIISGLFLGITRPDQETNGFVDGTDNNNGNAIDDDAPIGTGTGNGDDEDNFTLPTLTAGATSYTIPLGNITATNTTGQAATLHAWIDFNKNGKFDSTEYTSVTVNSGTSGGNPTANLTWSGISVGTTGNTYARFRLTSDSSITNATPGGAANNGEVEDYQIAIIAPPSDYGDAPSSYGDAGHEILATPTVYLGSTKPDQESGTQLGTDNGAAATGDDNNSTTDDEDAFTTLAKVSTIDNYDIVVPVTNTSGGNATLQAWVDFNKNGKFESGEYQSATVANNSASANLNWTIPSNTTSGDTYIRFRLTTATLTDDSGTTTQDERSIGNVINGEVEDYKVAIEPVPSLPASSVGSCEVAITNGSFETPALTAASPIPHEIFEAGKIVAYNENDVPGWTSFADSYIELWRNGNNTSGNPPAYEGEQFAEINAYVNGSLYQDVYTIPGSIITWQFAHRGRAGVDTMNLKIGSPGATVAQNNPTNGTTSFETGNTAWVVYQGIYTVPPGQTTTRFEYKAVATATGDQGVGNFIDAVRFGPLCDHGDAKSDYPVLRNNSGAAHVNDGVTFLGSKIRIELDGQPSAAADGDDGIATDTDQIDDEDGVTFVTSTLNAGTSISLNVVASVPGYLNAWIDFNQNNDWNDPGEKVFTDRSLNAGTNNLSLAIPANANTGNTFARFRFSTNTGINPTGIVASGEVEDYQIAIAPAIASNPKLLLVKRITAINPGQTDAIQFNNFVDDGSPTDDEAPNWPTKNTYLRGEINVEKIKPGDEVEYTIYFLSNGSTNINKISLCDVIPDNMTFVSNSYGNGKGIGLSLNDTELQNTPNSLLSNSTSDSDQGKFYLPNITPPAFCKKIDSNNDLVLVNGANNINGAVVLDLGNYSLPPATAPGIPTNSYGFIRFRAKVK